MAYNDEEAIRTIHDNMDATSSLAESSSSYSSSSSSSSSTSPTSTLFIQYQQTLQELESLKKDTTILRDRLLQCQREKEDLINSSLAVSSSSRSDNPSDHIGTDTRSLKSTSTTFVPHGRSLSGPSFPPPLDAILASPTSTSFNPLTSSYTLAPLSHPSTSTNHHSPKYLSSAVPGKPSPLRNASFPPYPLHSDSEEGGRVSDHSANAPSSSLRTSEHLNNVTSEATSILITRLRHERDDALNKIAFLTVEHDTASTTLLDEIEELRSGRDILRHDLEDMVKKLMSHENAERELSQITDALCESEAKERQASSRLESAHAEIDMRRQQLLQHSGNVVSEQQAIPHQLTKDNGVSNLQEENVSDSLQTIREMQAAISSLEDELLAARTSETGSSNLALLLRKSLEEADKVSANVLQELEESRQCLHRSEQKHQAADTAYQGKIENLEMELETLREDCARSHLEWEGSANLALSLQHRLNCTLTNMDILKCDLTLKENIIQDLEMDFQEQHSTIVNLRNQNMQMHGNVQAAEESFQSLLVAALQTRSLSLQLPEYAPQSTPSTLRWTTSGSFEEIDSRNMILAMVCLNKDLRDLNAKYRHEQGALQKVERQCRVQETNVQQLRKESAETLASLEARTTDTIAQLQQESDGLKEEAATAVQGLKRVESELSQKNLALEAVHSALNLREHEVAELRVEYRSLQTELEIVRQNLNNAEEEGRNLVTDFNMLSEELEQRQKVEDARSVHLHELESKLAEALKCQANSASDVVGEEKALQELKERLEQLEDMLGNMQADVEETDDKYLTSLKKIKTQAQIIDRLKLRIESLTRANALLETSMKEKKLDFGSRLPSPTHRKRSLPEDFISPDPGPIAMAQATHQSVFFTNDDVAQSRNQPTLTTKQTGRSAVSEDRSVRVQYNFTSPKSAEMVKEIKTGDLAKPAANEIPHRRPLAPLPAQTTRTKASQQFGKMLKIDDPKSSTVKSQPHLQQTLPPLSARLPSKQASNHLLKERSAASSHSNGRTDTKSLLAALQALKQPPRS